MSHESQLLSFADWKVSHAMSKRKGDTKECSRLTDGQALRLAALPNCSVTQAAEVAHTLGHFPEISDKKKKVKYVQNACATVSKKYRSEYLECISCDEQKVWLTKLQSLLQNYCRRSPAFSKTMLEAIQSTTNPLQMVLYCDETVSGNPLNPIASKMLGLALIF